MNPSRAAISARVDALDPASFQALVEEYAQIHFPGRFQNLQRRGSNIKGETIAGWPDGYTNMPDNRIDVLEVTRARAWRSHLDDDIEKASATQFTGKIGGFVFVAWARTPDPALCLKFQGRLIELGIPRDQIALIFQQQLVSDLGHAKFALLWEKYLGLQAHCLPFQLIEQAAIYGSAHQTNIFTPAKEEYTQGLVHRPFLMSQVEQHLNGRGWALVRGKGASGKTVMATQIAMGETFRAAPAYYLDIASLVSANEPDSSSALDVITSRRDQGVLFIVDNIHLDEQMAREIFDYWQSTPAGSFLLLLGRWTEPGPNVRGTDASLGNIDQEALRLEVSDTDLFGVLFRLAARSGLRDQIDVPPVEVVRNWLSLFGGDLVAFSAAVALNIRQMALGKWGLTADDAKEYIRSTYLYPLGNPLTDDEQRNLLLIALLSRLELEVPYAAIKKGDISRSLGSGIVHRIDYDAGKVVRFRLVHPGFGDLLLSAADPPVVEEAFYEEFALRTPAEAILLARRLEALGKRDAVVTVLRALAEEPVRLRQALLYGGKCSRVESYSNFLCRFGITTLPGIDEVLSGDPDCLVTAAMNTDPGGPLKPFLQYAQRALPKSYTEVIAGTASPNSLTPLVKTSLRTPFIWILAFLDYADGQGDLRPVYRAIATAFAEPSNLPQLVENALHTPLADLASFLGYAELKLPKVYAAIARALAEPSALPQLVEKALQTPLDHLASFLGYAELKLPKVYGAIATALADPSNLSQLVENTLDTPLDHIVSFFRFGLSKKQLQDIPAKVLAGIEQPIWDRGRLESPPEQPNYVHAASGLFQQLGRPELMVAPAQGAIMKAEASYWHAPGVGIHHLGQVMRHGCAVDQERLWRFLQLVVTNSWLEGQYTSATAGAIAACLFGVWAYYNESVVNYFLTGALGRRLAMELSRLRRLDDRELAGAISLFGCCSLMVARLRVSPKWPAPRQIQEMLRFFEAQAPANQLSNATVLRWVGLREISRLMPEDIHVPREIGESVLARWRNAETKLERHLRLTSIMISWLARCSGSEWHLLREPNSLFDELAQEATNRPPEGGSK